MLGSDGQLGFGRRSLSSFLGPMERSELGCWDAACTGRREGTEAVPEKEQPMDRNRGMKERDTVSCVWG